MVSKKKKIIVLSVMMGLLVLTGFLNITLNQNTGEAIHTGGNVTTSANFFTTYRADRDTAREQEKLYYTAILQSANSSAEAKNTAQESLANIASKIESELYLEGNIKAKGFNDVIVSMTNNFVNVMVKASELTDEQVAQIVQVVQDQTKKSIDNIKIIPVE